jgi:hypothetical protein
VKVAWLLCTGAWIAVVLLVGWVAGRPLKTRSFLLTGETDFLFGVKKKCSASPRNPATQQPPTRVPPPTRDLHQPPNHLLAALPLAPASQALNVQLACRSIQQANPLVTHRWMQAQQKLRWLLRQHKMYSVVCGGCRTKPVAFVI